MKDKFEEIEDQIASMNPVGTLVGDMPDILPIVNLDHMPLLPLRGLVAFEHITMPIVIGRESSHLLCTEAAENNIAIFLATQKNTEEDDIKKAEIYDVGVVARIVKTITLPDGTTTAFIATEDRATIKKINRKGEYLVCSIKDKPTKYTIRKNHEMESAALIASVTERFKDFIDLIGEDETRELRFTLSQIDDPVKMANFICSNAPVDFSVKQQLLEINQFDDRMQSLLYHIDQAYQLLEMKINIGKRTHESLSQQQKEQFLQQQIRTIQDELNSGEDEDIRLLRERASRKVWNDETQNHFDKELKKLERLNPMNPEYNVQYGYLDTFLNLPWGNYSESQINLDKAEKVLNHDHYGLEKVKDRILEHLAVIKLRGDLKSPILCLYGPPGVGKTSLGKSIASAMGREYARISLGGVHDEAEIRGHRRTYIGAMPGRIITALEKCGTGNPVIVLDEIDKIGQDFKGDPSTALLEVLDPEQNMKFHDNFIDLDYDLSHVFFVATANNLSTISAPLRDRMEIIDISGYIPQEKVEIARRHLIPKELENNGFTKDEITFLPAAIKFLIESYTRESGVRLLEKTISKVLRKIARLKASDKTYPVKIDKKTIKELIGKEEVTSDIYENNDFAGVVTGLAWTSVGGEILFIESSLSEGKGILTMTGNLGDVMKESATLALQYLKSNARMLDLNPKDFATTDVHIHVPEGAIPKDGPSAGITMVTSLASSFTRRKVRAKLAMTGEITLRGKVLPVGGIKEKILAAKRSGITDVILSSQNRKDIEEIDSKYLSGVKFHYVDRIDEVLDFALLDEKVE